MNENMEVPKHLRKIDNILEYDFLESLVFWDGIPFLFVGQTPEGKKYLFHWLKDNDELEISRYALISTNDEKIEKIKNKELTLLEAYECDTCLIIDLGYNSKQLNLWEVKWSDMNKEELPDADAYLEN